MSVRGKLWPLPPPPVVVVVDAASTEVALRMAMVSVVNLCEGTRDMLATRLETTLSADEECKGEQGVLASKLGGGATVLDAETENEEEDEEEEGWWKAAVVTVVRVVGV